MKQLTDEEIIKALEYCIDARHNPAFCELCPYFQYKDDCVVKSVKDIVNLINRQKAEIERLKQLTDELSSYFPSCIGCNGKNHEGVRTDECVYLIGDTFYCAKRGLENIINTKSEAYKEFAQRLKEAYPESNFDNKSPAIHYDFYCDMIDETLQEMVDE